MKEIYPPPYAISLKKTICDDRNECYDSDHLFFFTLVFIFIPFLTGFALDTFLIFRIPIFAWLTRRG